VVTVVIVAMLALGLSINSNFALNEEKTIKIGGIFSLTGDWAYGAIPEARFAQIAIDEINVSGGINGKPIEFILEDARTNPVDAISAANKLINIDNVKFILGPDTAPNSAAVIPITNSNKVFTMSATTTAKDVLNDYEYAFRVSPDSRDGGGLIGELAAKKYNLKRMAMIFENSNFDLSWAEDTRDSFEENGGEVLLFEKYNTGSVNLKTVLLKASTLNLDVIYVSGRAPMAVGNILKQIKEQGLFEDTMLIGHAIIMNQNVIEASGSYFPENNFSVEVYAENAELLEKYVSRYKEEPSFIFFFNASMYDAVYMLKEAIEACDEEVTCVKEYFHNEINAWGGEVADWSFNEFGDPLIPTAFYKEISIVNGEKIRSDISLN
jgi:branched-chain amino acid transport system substrate-binding protein